MEQVRQAFPAPAHRVEVACTGAEGIERVRRDPPDLIILDMRLPDQTGLEVYQAVRGIDARIPVIFVTVAKTAGLLMLIVAGLTLAVSPQAIQDNVRDPWGGITESTVQTAAQHAIDDLAAWVNAI